MKYGKLVLLVIAASFLSCANDDNNQIEVVPPRLLAEVAPENDEEIQEYLNTHFYNYEEFLSPPADFDYKIVVDTIAGANADKTPLADFVEERVIDVSSSQLGLTEEENDVPHTLYYLIARTGAGGNPTVADSVLVRYEGMLLDGTRFDASTSFLWQQLPFTIRGYGNGIDQINAASDTGEIVNPDGTFGFSDSGIGLIIMPSGLAYFAGGGPGGTIPAYANIVFQVEVGRLIEDTDSDNDGVPSILEDINGNGYLFDDNTDSELEPAGTAGFPDFQDGDDDGDGVSTRSEITDDQGNIIFPYPDSNNDGTPDYLDPDTN